MTGLVTLVVQPILPGVFSPNTHILKGDFPSPGDHHMVDVDGIVPRPEDPLINPQQSTLIDERFDKAHHVPDRKPRYASETLIRNPGMLAEHVCLGEDRVKHDAFRAGNLDTAVDSL